MIVLVALLMPVLLAVLALVVDVGTWYVHKRTLQNQVDAAALAAGAVYGNCFGAGGAAALQTEAAKYGGGVYNPQAGGASAGTLTLLYNSKTYAKGGPAADDTPADACDGTSSPPYVFDVKGTDADIPLIFSGLLPGVGPVSQINAHARVQLFKENITSKPLPLAVADVRPTAATATFVDLATGARIGSATLADGGPSGGLEMWSGTATVTVPSSGGSIGVRIGLGKSPENCDGTLGSAQFVCYDNQSSSTGLVQIRAYPATPAGAQLTPQLRGSWPTTTCSGSPFFTDASLGGGTTCGAGVQAAIDFGTGSTRPDTAIGASVTATVNGATQTLTPQSYDAAAHTWLWATAGNAFGLGVGLGSLPATLDWTVSDYNPPGGGKNCKAGSPCKGTFGTVQRLYSGSDAGSGPIKTLALTSGDPSPTVGSPYALDATTGTHTVNVTVGVQGSLTITTAPVLLRETSGSRSSAIICNADAPNGDSEFVNELQNGCSTPYQINPSGICPDPSPPAGPADCIPLKTGGLGSTVSTALNTRFASCPDNFWTAAGETSDPATDPRAAQLIVTDFTAVAGSGKTSVPVVDIATFYVTGWSGSTCAKNEPWPFPSLAQGSGDIWGHYVKNGRALPGTGGNTPCDIKSVTPCVAKLTK